MFREIFRIYTLRLLAGKFVAICTEFPLATFTAKILTRLSKKSLAKNYFSNPKHAMLKD